jgi:hypothetical protein
MVLHKKPHGCSASVASAARPFFNKKNNSLSFIDDTEALWKRAEMRKTSIMDQNTDHVYFQVGWVWNNSYTTRKQYNENQTVT